VSDTFFSGGAEGADTAWGEQAKKAGHQVHHFVFKGHHNSKIDGAVIIPPDRLVEADPTMKRVNDEVLHRSFPAHSVFVTNLLRRNYFQVVNSDAVYAVAGIDGTSVFGGTAWAIEAFKILNPHSNNIFVFDQENDGWYRWNPETSCWVSIGTPPSPSGRWTGIGTWTLEHNGQEAIEALFLPS
jgi:hypothetical protein